MKKIIGHKLEHGQIIPVLAVGTFLLAAMAVLLLDVGAMLVYRRSAQNAADAGALAGARILCSNQDPDLPSQAIGDEILHYTEVENHATLVEWYFTDENIGDTVGLRKGEIVVTAEVEHESFFAKIFGDDILSAKATAGAGCFPYQADIVLPIAWSCRPPAAGSASEDCDIIKVDYATVEEIANNHLPRFPLLPGVDPTDAQARAISEDMFAVYQDRTYIVMESDKVCGDPTVDPNTINCDWLDDGVSRNQLESGGNRGWLNLEGGPSSANHLREWIEHGASSIIQPHTWLNGIPGNNASVYTSLNTRLDEIVWVPVFNVICGEYPTNACYDAAHESTPPGLPLDPGQQCNVVQGSTDNFYYHIITFAPFMPTCVQKPGNGEECPGFALAQLNNPDPQHPDDPTKSTIPDNTLTFEGYFVDPETLGEGVSYGADLGIYTVSLTR